MTDGTVSSGPWGLSSGSQAWQSRSAVHHSSQSRSGPSLVEEALLGPSGGEEVRLE